MVDQAQREFQPVGPILGSGVYALAFYGEIVYIGKAKRVLHRVYAHRNMWDRQRQGKKLPATGPFSTIKAVRFTEIMVIPCAEVDLDRVEKEMIAKHRPKHNVRLVPEGRVSLEVAGFDFAPLGVLFAGQVEPFVRRI